MGGIANVLLHCPGVLVFEILRGFGLKLMNTDEVLQKQNVF